MRRCAAAGAILALAGCHLLTSGLRGDRELSAFPHESHVRDQAMRCDACHPGSRGEPLPGFPARADCEACHGPPVVAPFFAEEAARWVHAGRQSAEIVFDHPAHARRGECLACHGDVASSSAITSGMRARMDECTACHEKEAPRHLACESCHREIRRSSPPHSHDAGWPERHGEVWRAGTSDRTVHRCELCHARGACDDCHTTRRPRSHDNYWRGRGHGIAAGIDRSRCETCHRRDTCDRCHATTRPPSHRAGFGSPSNAHCRQCHLPVDLGESCGVCHLSAPSHERAAAMPADAAHLTSTATQCRACHTPVPHPDNGDDCRYCHR